MSNDLSPTQNLVKQFYKDEKGDPIILSRGQDVIFRCISQKVKPRVHIMCHTRFGKSLTVGLGGLTRVSTFPEKWSIIAGTKEKAKIIMDYVIAHIFDNDYTASRFVPDKGDNIDDIRRYRNKNRLNFQVGTRTEQKAPGVYEKVKLYGEIFVGSAKDALGFGAPNVIEDESALINDAEHSLVMRMLGDNPFENFMVKIGNPFERNHFLKSYHDPAYLKVIIDCYKSLQEGRISQAVIDENKDYPYFGVLYECKFPSASEVDESGWMNLLTDIDIKIAQQRNHEDAGKRRLGIDVSRGGRNYNCWVIRSQNTARVIKKTQEPNLIPVMEDTINIMHELGIPPEDVFVDDTGVGGGLVDMLKLRNIEVNAVKLGESAEKYTDPQGKEVSDYANVRAEIYAGKEGVLTWVKGGGKLEPHADWIELTRIRYKKDASTRTKIEGKDDMLKRGVQSPDVADALALTFAKPKKVMYYGNKLNPYQVLTGNTHGGVSW